MKKYVAIFFLIITSYQLKAQDYIVVNGKDTIACEINEVGTKRIFFTVINEGVPYQQSLLLSQVNNYYFNHTNNQNDSLANFKNKQQNVTFENSLRVGLSYGFGYLTGKVQDEDEAPSGYIEELRSGTNFGFEAHYFPGTLNYGLGIKLSRFQTSNQINQIAVIDDQGNQRIGTLRDDITMNFIGGSIIMKWLKPNKITGLYFDVAFGKSFYTNDAILIDNFKIKAERFSINTTLNYDVKINNYFAFGASLEHNWTNFESFEVNGRTIRLRDNTGESSRLNFLVGIKGLIH